MKTLIIPGVAKYKPPPKGTFGRTIYDARKALGLNQKQAGARCGVSERAWKDWERNRQKPSAPCMMLIQQLLADAKNS